MKINYNFEEIEEALYEPIKPDIKIKKKFWNGAIVLTQKNFEEILEYIGTLENDLKLLRNFIKIQKKLDNLRTKDEFNFDNYIKITSEEGYDEEFERVRNEFKDIITKEQNDDERV